MSHSDHTNGDSRLPVPVETTPRALVREQGGRALARPFDTWEPPTPGVQDYVNVFLRRKWAVIISLAVVLMASIVITAITPRTYEATATVLVTEPPKQDSGQANSSQINPLTAAGSPNMETHVQLLQGDAEAVETAAWLRQHGGPELTPEVLEKRISSKSVRDTQLIRISAISGRAEDAQRIANAAAQAYISMNQRRARGGSETTGKFLGEQLEMVKQNVTRAENAVRAYKETTGTVSADASATDLTGRVASLQAECDRTGADLAQARQRLSQINRQLSEQNRIIGGGGGRDDVAIQKLKGQLADLKQKRMAAAAKYTSEFSEPVRQLDDQIKQLEAQLETEIRRVVRGPSGDLAIQQQLTSKRIDALAEVSALSGRHSQLQAELAQARSSLTRIPGRQLELANLQRQLDVAQGVYSDLLKKGQEVEVGRVMALGNVDVAEAASRPRLPVKPNVPLNLVLGLFLGLALGVGVALLQDQLDDSVRDPAEASRLASAPVLGTIPAFARPEQPGLLPASADHNNALEAYRALRYCLDFVTPGERARAILVTSAGPSEGKSTTVLNLARAVALTGKRVLLVDTDLRRFGLRRMLKIEETRGLTDVLMGEAELGEVLQKNIESGLTLLTAGKQVPNATELLDSPAMRQLLEALRDEADLVIFDSPPVLSVADTLVLASLADAVLMVCVAGQSHRHDVQLARQLLSHVGENITGIVLNKVGQKAGYGYHNRYYYY
jgi:polysaccharide biosynthesis transport protein